MLKSDRRAARRRKAKYGHHGLGSSHTREASGAEIRKHIEKARKQRR